MVLQSKRSCHEVTLSGVCPVLLLKSRLKWVQGGILKSAGCWSNSPVKITDFSKSRFMSGCLRKAKFQSPKTTCWFQRPNGMARVSQSHNGSTDFEKYFLAFSKTNIPILHLKQFHENKRNHIYCLKSWLFCRHLITVFQFTKYGNSQSEILDAF